MEAFLQSPVIAYILLTVLLLEMAVLFWLWKTRQQGLPPLQVVSFLGAGMAFSFALWVLLADADAKWLGLCLIGAFVFHLADLKLRWRTRA